jgi:TatD DNase family protein
MPFLNLHTHKFTNNPAILELVNQYPWEFDAAIPHYSIGIHPWFIDEKRLETDLQTIDEKLFLPACLALGECGLDKRVEIPLYFQKEVFIKQIFLAEKHNKPIVLHCVAAFQEVIEIKNRHHVSVPMIVHGFSKNMQTAKQLIDNGFYLSFGKYLLQNPDLKEVFQSVPNDKFFLETDTLDQTIAEFYAIAAEYKGMTLEALQLQLDGNWKIFFER